MLTLQQKVQKAVLSSFPNSYFPAFMGRMLQAQGSAAATPPFLKSDFCSRKCNYEAYEGMRSARADRHFRWKQKSLVEFFIKKNNPC